jgi:RimJ/RimL family protein N-acetyltransferase
MFALTPRLTLRPGWPEDAPALARAIGHEAVVRNLSRAPWPYDLTDAEAFLALPRGAHEARFQICERFGDHRLIGGIGLHRDEHGRSEIGYWLAPHAWGRGYATEAGHAVLDMARHALRLTRVVGRHFVDNPASGRVLRKLGMIETGTRSRLPTLSRGGAVDCVDYAIDWSDDVAEVEPRPLPIAA